MTSNAELQKAHLSLSQLANAHRFFAHLLPLPRKVVERTIRDAFEIDDQWRIEGTPGFFVNEVESLDQEVQKFQTKPLQMVYQISEWAELSQGEFEQFESSKGATKAQSSFNEKIDQELQNSLGISLLKIRHDFDAGSQPDVLEYIDHYLHSKEKSKLNLRDPSDDIFDNSEEHLAYLTAMNHYLVDIPRNRLQDVLSIKHNTEKNNTVFLRNVLHLCKVGLFSNGEAEIPDELNIKLKHIGIRLEIKYNNPTYKWEKSRELFEELITRVEEKPTERVVRYLADFLHHCTRRKGTANVHWIEVPDISAYYNRIHKATKDSSLPMRVKDYVECFRAINTFSTQDQIKFLGKFTLRATDEYMRAYSSYILASYLPPYSEDRSHNLFKAFCTFSQTDKTRAQSAIDYLCKGIINTFDNETAEIHVESYEGFSSKEIQDLLAHLLTFVDESFSSNGETERQILEILFETLNFNLRFIRGRCASCEYVHRPRNNDFVTTRVSLDLIIENINKIVKLDCFKEDKTILQRWEELIHLALVWNHEMQWGEWKGGDFILSSSKAIQEEYRDSKSLVEIYLNDFSEHTVFEKVTNFYRHISEPHISLNGVNPILEHASELIKTEQTQTTHYLGHMLSFIGKFQYNASDEKSVSEQYDAYLSKHLTAFFEDIDHQKEISSEEYLLYLSMLSSNQEFGRKNKIALRSRFFTQAFKSQTEAIDRKEYNLSIIELFKEVVVIIQWAHEFQPSNEISEILKVISETLDLVKEQLNMG